MAWYAGQYDRASEQLRQALETDANHPLLVWTLGLVSVSKGMYDEGVAELTRAAALDPSVQFVAYLGYAYALAGKQAEASKILSDLTSRSMREYVAPDALARICVGLGDLDQALAWLDRGYEDHSGWMAYLAVDATFAPLRAYPRFQALLRRMNFPETAAPTL